MAVQDVREQNLDAEGFIRAHDSRLATVFAQPALEPFHYHAELSQNHKAIVFTGSTNIRLALSSLTIALADPHDAHFIKVVFRDHAAKTERYVTNPLAVLGTLHLAYPHPIVLPLTPSKKWSLYIEDEGPTGALVNATLVGFTFVPVK